MIRNYLTNVYRSLSRRPTYAIINIVGLTAGIAVCLLIFVIIRFETSFDGYHKNANRLYRVLTEYHHPGDLGIFYGADAPMPMPSVIKTLFPDLKKSSGIASLGSLQVFALNAGGQIEKKFKENSG